MLVWEDCAVAALQGGHAHECLSITIIVCILLICACVRHT